MTELRDVETTRLRDLRCNDLTGEAVIDRSPRFSWVDERTATHYVVEVMAAGRTLWTSAALPAGCRAVAYGGPELQPRTPYRWRLRAYEGGRQAAVAEAVFRTGKRDERWRGRWIGAPYIRDERASLGAVYLRRRFELEAAPSEAWIWLTGLGFYELYVNGTRVGEAVLEPSWTHFDRRVEYRGYDIAGLLTGGENVLAIVLGTGWYSCFTDDAWRSKHADWRHWPKCIAELYLGERDGQEACLISDGQWRVAPGPIYFNGVRHGERCDMRRHEAGWGRPGFDDAHWSRAAVVRGPGGVLRAAELEPIKAMEEGQPQRIRRVGPHLVVDFDRAYTGYARLRLTGPRGSQFTIRYSDRLDAEGRPDIQAVNSFIRNYGFQTDHYIKGTDEPEVWAPRFVWHGFRHVELSATCPLVLEAEDVTAIGLRNAVATTSQLTSSDPGLDGIVALCQRSSRAVLQSAPMADTIREKLSWTGDVAVSSEQLLLNHGARALLRKWMADVRDAQRPNGAIPCIVPTTGWGYNSINGPDWSSALNEVPWWLYVTSGDLSHLEENYEANRRHFDFMESMAVDDLVHYGLGDWCAPFDGPALAVNMGSFRCPTALSDSAFYHSAACRLAAMAGRLGADDDAAYYRERAEAIRRAYRRRFLDPATGRVLEPCQSAVGITLYHGMVEAGELPALVAQLEEEIAARDGHLDFGILGLKSVMHGLGEYGRADLALGMLLAEGYPGPLDWLAQGATELWECWNGNGSRNHHMFSDFHAFIVKFVAGLAPRATEPGFAALDVQPALYSGPRELRCALDTAAGTAAIAWTRSADARAVELEIELPSASSGWLYLSDASGDEHIAVGGGEARPLAALERRSRAVGIRELPGPGVPGLALAAGQTRIVLRRD